jgi:hypothetical protein
VLPGARTEPGAPARAEHRPLLGQVLSTAVVEETGTFYYVADMMSDSRSRMLYSLSLDPSRKDFKPVEIPLHQAKYVPQNTNYTVCSLVASRDHLALLVSPAQPDGQYRLLTWRISDLKDRALSLLPQRTLGVNRPGGLGLGADGTLYVYNVPRGKTSAGAGRAYVTAFNLNAPPENDPVLWDAMAPALGDPVSSQFLPDSGAYAVLSSPRGSFPDDAGEAAACIVVYDKTAEGTVVITRQETGNFDLGGRPFASLWRGRLYLLTSKALEVYGN